MAQLSLCSHMSANRCGGQSSQHEDFQHASQAKNDLHLKRPVDGLNFHMQVGNMHVPCCQLNPGAMAIHKKVEAVHACKFACVGWGWWGWPTGHNSHPRSQLVPFPPHRPGLHNNMHS
jgi:hypothetical protein